jgi:signal transduction histidine kinase
MDTQETKIYLAILIAAIALAIIIIFFIINIWRHQRRSLQLYKEKVSAEITTLENERKRLASDLHDDLGPLLSAIKLQIGSLDIYSEEDKILIKKINAYLDEVVQKIRTTSNDLVPLVLLRKGFNKAIDQFASSINDTGKIFIEVNRETSEEPPSEATIHLYRMIQEIINNTIKHAEASNCKIITTANNNKMNIVVSDNGKGFNFQKISRQSLGFGLQNILSRADIIKAKIYINSKPQQGVSYEIELPIAHHEK